MKKVIFLLLITQSIFACNPPKEKNNDVRYSQLITESCALGTFLSNTKEQQLETAEWDYVAGLVAYSVLKAWVQYPEKTAYYDIVKKYADHCLQGSDTIKVGVSNLDDLAAGKIFFTLYKTELAKGNTTDAQRYKNCLLFFRNKLKYKHNRIPATEPGAGGFFHKAQYPDQMWLDGLYMGPALYAEFQSNFGEELGAEDNLETWNDIALQFKTIHQYTYDSNKKLNYHAWSANPSDPNSFWAKKEEPNKGCSPEFWGRGMGWYFAALVDVLELMPKTHPDYQTLVNNLNQVAEGLKARQDKASGCWYQLLQYDNKKTADNIGDSSDGKTYNQCNKPNYLESSASSMFTYAYFKGIRLGILDRKIYEPVAQKAYSGLIKTFIRKNETGKYTIIQSCASAGLGPAKDPSRTGTANYYLCGKDVSITQNEGKAIGPFIMASLEYESACKTATKQSQK